ncbi:hypothetical protein [Streptomyces murinus]|uniref:hypothetical protein n=1 Tax=Streptomyces murinus TaxID=33900 RepID=UPI00382A2243
MTERRPTDEERKKERAEARPPSPKDGGGFDVQPRHLYYTSLVVRDGQFGYDKGATALVGVLNDYSQSAGVGGVAVGLTDTANKYRQADWQARRMQGPPSPPKPPPAVIDTAPRYGPVNDIKWSGTGQDADSSEIAGILGTIPDFLADVIRPAVEHGLRLGKMHEITPGCKDDEFKDMATAWGAAAKAAKGASDDFNGAIKFITDNKGNDEWQGAVKAFCQTIWGTTEWGRTYDPQGQRVSIGRSWKTSPQVSTCSNCWS